LRRVALIILIFAVAVFGARAAMARVSSIVIDAASGRILHAVNVDQPRYPASLTKIMTLYMVFEALETGRLTLDRKLPVSRVAAGRSPAKLGLKRGEKISVRAIIGALVTKSANDAATVVAEALGGTERKFARLMTAQARRLGMTRTVFRNASGLPHSRQRTTARDMAILGRAVLRRFPGYYRYFSMRRFTYGGRTYVNHNRMIRGYDGVDGIKTGYIRASGFNLAASVKRDGRRLIGIVFGGRSPRERDRRMARLFDRAFARLEKGGLVQSARGPTRAVVFPPPPRRKPRIAARAAVRPPPLNQIAWSIQVGAFRRYAPAHLAVTRAARLVPALLGQRVSIYRSLDSRGTVYRARLVGLSESKARRSCRALVLKKVSCVVLPRAGPPRSG
jgi:D-alanyl-D-alanine carboxypeptidase